MRETQDVRLTGWNDIPIGYGAHFELRTAPIWLRVLYRTPFLDRFAYPALVRRGLGVLSPHPHWADGEQTTVTGGWRVDDDTQPGSVSPLTSQCQP
jgi:hypothetical protein